MYDVVLCGIHPYDLYGQIIGKGVCEHFENYFKCFAVSTPGTRGPERSRVIVRTRATVRNMVTLRDGHELRQEKCVTMEKDIKIEEKVK